MVKLRFIGSPKKMVFFNGSPKKRQDESWLLETGFLCPKTIDDRNFDEIVAKYFHTGNCK